MFSSTAKARQSSRDENSCSMCTPSKIEDRKVDYLQMYYRTDNWTQMQRTKPSYLPVWTGSWAGLSKVTEMKTHKFRHMLLSVAVVELVRFPVWLNCFTWIPVCATTAQLCDKRTATYLNCCGKRWSRNEWAQGQRTIQPKTNASIRFQDTLPPFKRKSPQISLLSCTMRSKCISLAQHANVFIIVNLLQHL